MHVASTGPDSGPGQHHTGKRAMHPHQSANVKRSSKLRACGIWCTRRMDDAMAVRLHHTVLEVGGRGGVAT